MIIPDQLRNKGFRFIKLGQAGTSYGKCPIEKDYLLSNNYEWYDTGFNFHHMLDEHNYGVLGGFGNLVIIDFDSKWFQDKVKLPPTFTVASGGKGLHHKYFIIEDNPEEMFRKFKVKADWTSPGLPPIGYPFKGQTMADVMSYGGFVVGPGCVHESGRRYEIVDPRPVNSMTIQGMRNCFGEHWNAAEPSLPKIGLSDFSNIDFVQIKRDKKCRDILQDYGVEFKGRYKYECPVHPCSDGNQANAAVYDDQNSFYCFHSEHGGSVIDLIMHLEDCSFKDAVKKLKEYG